MKQEIAKEVCLLSLYQILNGDGLFSLVDIVLGAAKGAFTGSAVKKAFQETGVVPYNCKIIESLVKINHCFSSDQSLPKGTSQTQELLAEKVAHKVQKCLTEMKKKGDEKQEKIKRCTVVVHKNQGYFADEILVFEEKRKMEKENLEKEKVEKKKRT